VDARVQNPADSSVGDLFSQLVADGRNLVSAEVNLYKQIAAYRAGKAKTGIVALVAGGLLAFAALIAFMVGVVIDLGELVDSAALGGLIVLLVVGVIAFLLFRFGAGKMTALSGDADEKAALRAGGSRV
jgi:hypothetical protein